MKKHLFNEKYPIKSVEIPKDSTFEKTFQDLLDYFHKKIEIHPVAKFIADFDHISHTKEVPDGFIASDILKAQDIIFCFGKRLESPLQLSVRPRSIGVVETKTSFFLSFLEAPSPIFNELMEQWTDDLTL